MLGVQGRMDLLTRDLDVVIEQKSGKKEFATQGPHLHHRIQVLLYMAILHYAHHKRYSEINAYLLYSKYAGKEGLIRVQNVPKLLQQAFEVRNRMVVRDLEFAERGSADFFEEFTPEQLHTLSCGVLWERYKLPEYLDFINVFRSATPEERAYFFRFHRFLALEQLRAKLGSSQREASGFAAAWLSTLDEKMQAGNIMPQLCLDRGGYKTSATGAILEVRLLSRGRHFHRPQLPKGGHRGLLLLRSAVYTGFARRHGVSCHDWGNHPYPHRVASSCPADQSAHL